MIVYCSLNLYISRSISRIVVKHLPVLFHLHVCTHVRHHLCEWIGTPNRMTPEVMTFHTLGRVRFVQTSSKFLKGPRSIIKAFLIVCHWFIFRLVLQRSHIKKIKIKESWGLSEFKSGLTSNARRRTEGGNKHSINRRTLSWM